MSKKIVIAVGGTGGHVLPAMKIGKRLSQKFEVVYVGVDLSNNRFFDSSLMHYDIEGAGLAEGFVACGKKNIKGMLQARTLLKELQPEFVIGFGSYHSFPVLAAAVYLDIPHYLVEFNTVPGMVNRLFSRSSKATFIHFDPQVKKLPGRLIKIDYAFENVTPVSREEALRYFGLEPSKKTLLVFGGSQGSHAINDLVIKGSAKLKEEFQILHFSGKEKNSFCDRMDLAWTAADLAICRSGAGALREMLIYEKPAILIPYPAAKDNHQMYNAKYMEEVVKGATCLVQEGLTPELLVKEVFATEKKIESMKQAIRIFKQRENRPDIYSFLHFK